MKKTLLALSLGLSIFALPAIGQEKCLSEIQFQEDAAKNPGILKDRSDFEDYMQHYKQHFLAQNRSALTPLIIPVVVHVIHANGAENISDAQILDQIDSLNKDFRRLNADTVNTPAVFQSVAADCNIEFRMAQLDPNGNCTNGIVRVFSYLTQNARNNVKALSYWPSDRYLNMWIVASIANTSGAPGDVIGFAQFPGASQNPLTDGVVIKHDFMGSIGTAALSGNAGRTATHEIGHWLNLRHIWGDAQCGDDFVSDTPPHFGANLSICPSWPSVSNCAGNFPNGDQFTNYMDYTNGDCQNMFSFGQYQRMDATLNSVASGRNNLWTSTNLTLTGTDGTPAVLCAPRADFSPRQRFICEGGLLNFRDNSWNGAVASRVWYFPGGTPATDTALSPNVTYSTPGTYDVSLVVTNAAGTDSLTYTGHVVVSPSNITSTVPFAEDFENGTFPYNDWYVLNSNLGNTWATTSNAFSSGSKSIYISNYNGNDKGPDEFITPPLNLSNVTQTTMTFDVAFALTNLTSSNTDKLTIYYSTNCGQSWTQRYTRAGTTLATVATAVPSTFTPNSSQWRTETVNLSPTSISTKPNVRLRFEFTHDTGNNIYIDDININGNFTGLDDINAENAQVNIYPNPGTTNTYVDFSTLTESQVEITVFDATGRMVSSFADQMPAGDHQYTLPNNLEKGVYIVKMSFGDRTLSRRVVLQ